MAEEKNDQAKQGDGVARMKHRSPNYPVIGLRKAVERAGELSEKYKRSTVPIHLVQELWGYKAHSGAGNQCVAALKAFGLIEVDGDAKNRRIRLSDAANRILGGSADRADLIKKAVLGPALYAELWDKYKDNEFPDRTLVEHYLKWDRREGTFNPDAIAPFMANFLDSLRYAKLLPESTMGDVVEPKNGTERETPSISEGDYVQWTSQRVDQFSEPQRVVGITDDGQWAFVEGSATGVPMNELSLQKQKSESQQAKDDTGLPPANPFHKPTTRPLAPPAPPPGLVEERTNLDEGPIILQWPGKLSEGSVEELEYWLEGVMRRARRAAGLPPEKENK